MGLSLENGSPLWRYPFPTRNNQNIITPLVCGGRLIVGGIGQTTVSLQLSGSTPDMKVKTIWENPKVPLHMSSPVLAGNRLFGLANRRKGQLFCIDASSGEAIWTSEGNFAEHLTMLHGNRHLVMLTNDGKLIFIRTDSETYQPLASYIVSDTRTWAHPLVNGSRIIIKDESKLTCWTLEQ